MACPYKAKTICRQVLLFDIFTEILKIQETAFHDGNSNYLSEMTEQCSCSSLPTGYEATDQKSELCIMPTPTKDLSLVVIGAIKMQNSYQKLQTGAMPLQS